MKEIVASMLIQSLNAEALASTLKRFKLTRRRHIPFCMNGKCYELTRREAIDLVNKELNGRQS